MSSSTAGLRTIAVMAVLVAFAGCRRGEVQSPLQQANITEHRGAPLPLDVTLTDAAGRTFRLRELAGHGTPLLINLAYFSCPMLCPLGRDGLAAALRESGLRPGADVQLLTVSIDPRDTPARAAEWQRLANASAGAPGTAPAWRVAVGQASEVRRLSDALGFLYAYDADSGQFSHSMALFVVDGHARISQYLYGFSVDPRALASAVDAARHDRTGGAVERLLLRCFHYVPSLRRHGGTLTWILRSGGAGIVFAVGWLLFRVGRAGSGRAA